MKLEIEKKEKPLLMCEEIIAVVNERTTPSNTIIKEEIAKKTGKPQELVVIKSIYQTYGKDESRIRAFVYNDADAMKKFEEYPKKKKQQGAVAEKEAEKPAEVKK